MVQGTLVAEGPSDRRLLPILAWVVRANGGGTIALELAQYFGRKPATLSGRIKKAVELFPCDILFVHRDNDNAPDGARTAEISTALAAADVAPQSVAVIPVRTQETWLLFNEQAIRKAAGYPNGRDDLGIPALNRLEAIADPKELLRSALRTASGLTGRRLKSFGVNEAAYRLADQIEDYSPLRQLGAFRQLEADVCAVIQTGLL